MSKLSNTTMLQIIFEDEWLVIVNKPAGLVVHANPGDDRDPKGRRPNLQSLLETQLSRKLTLYHRLDLDTTGLVILGKRQEINKTMTEAFAKKRLRKTYMAVVHGDWRPAWNKVENYLRREEGRGWMNASSPPGKQALTTFRLLKSNGEKSWIEALPKTGRTHQIRLHAAAKNCPVLGDRLYGTASENQNADPLALHAYRLDFPHPVSGQALRLFAPPPKYWLTNWLCDLDDGSRLELLLGKRRVDNYETVGKARKH